MKTTTTLNQFFKYLLIFTMVFFIGVNLYANDGNDIKKKIEDLKLKLNGQALAMLERRLSDNNFTIDQVFTVMESGDESDEDLNDGIFNPKTFRSALENANLTTDLDIIFFDESLTIINAQTSLSDLIANEPIWIDGTVANNAKIIIDGTNDWQFALWMTGGNSILLNVIMRNFPSGGLVIQGDENIIQGCEIYQNGGSGMNLYNVSNNLIGGSLPSERNIVYGNTGNGGWGISIHGEQNNNNTVEGNWIGTSDGVLPMGNEKRGVRIDQGLNNIIKNNVILDNGGGIDVYGDQLDGILIEGNIIGTDKTGTISIGNRDGTGIFIFEGDNILIKDNLVSGNFSGIGIMSGATHVIIEDNFLGTDISGSFGIGNTLYGILNRSDSIIIKGNLISGNLDNGIQQYIGSGGEIKSNIIGTNFLGTQAIGNFGYGIRVVFATGVIIGGDSLEDGNLISGNWKSGIYLSDNSTVGSMVKRNFIGTDFLGESQIGNLSDGILISRGSSNNKIIENLISGNAENGILITPENDLVPQNNEIQNNAIGTNFSGDLAIPNLDNGIVIDSCSNNLIGGESWEDGNLISGNMKNGIVIQKNGATGNKIQNNYIGTSDDSKEPIPNLLDGILILNAPNNIIGGKDSEGGNIISGNKFNGISIVGSNSTNNVVYGNKIGVDSTGFIDVGNKQDGIAINNAGLNKVGTDIEGWGNFISKNDSIGIFILRSPIGNTIVGNRIIENEEGIVLLKTSGNFIGFTTLEFGNIIGLNNKDGISIYGTNDTASTNNTISRNFIGVRQDDFPMPNGRDGIYIYGGNENQILWNKIGNNQEVGINIENGVSNQILPNNIFYNGSLGIDLNNDGVSDNDPDDSDTGANNLQNFPVINNAYSAVAGFITIEGKLLSSANTDFDIVFWYSDACDSSGYGEGEFTLGIKTVTTGNDGIIFFSFTFEEDVAVGKFITATATSLTDESTSEFCLCKTVDNPVDIAEYSDPELSVLAVNSVYPNPLT
ncbi:MAG: hypothetical protein DRI54_04150, partial [Bacteroidetes bacterium]